MEVYLENQPGQNWVQEQKQKKKIGILGGTFNPPHCTHIEMAVRVYKEFQLDLVLLLPTGNPPHKQGETIASREHREQMLRMAVEEYPFIEVCTIELKRPGITYTVDSLRALRQELGKNVVFYYIIGTDTLFQLETWKEFLDVFSMTEFICICRPGDESKKIAQKIAYMKTVYKKEIRLASYQGKDISSTAIRMRIREGKSIAGMVPAKVEEYLKRNDVY